MPSTRANSPAGSPPTAITGPIAYVIPTRDRAAVLDQTLRHLGALPRHDAEIVLVDNASATPVSQLVREGLGGAASGALANGLTIHVLRSEENLGAAGRNLGAEATDPACSWIVMLDDDSWPNDLGFIDLLATAPDTVGAIAGEIHLGGPERAGAAPQREAGGLPEVFTGCGVIIRRSAMLARDAGGLGGYDPSFGFYAEEYDLAARLMLAGFTIHSDRRAQFTHAKVQAGRDMNVILSRLVRNNGWVMQRYAPDECRRAEVRRVVDRYRHIAHKEHAVRGFETGLGELLRSIRAQPRTPLSPAQWDRFTGKRACRRWLLWAWAGGGGAGAVGGGAGFSTAALVDPGKNVHIVREVLDDLGVRIVDDERAAQVRVIATLSPGPMWDALERRRAMGQHNVLPAWEATGGELAVGIEQAPLSSAPRSAHTRRSA